MEKCLPTDAVMRCIAMSSIWHVRIQTCGACALAAHRLAAAMFEETNGLEIGIGPLGLISAWSAGRCAVGVDFS